MNAALIDFEKFEPAFEALAGRERSARERARPQVGPRLEGRAHTRSTGTSASASEARSRKAS